MEFLSEIKSAIKSVMAAMIGIQKKKNLEEDFSKKTALPFIVAGIMMTFVFILTIWAIVNIALNA